MPDPAPLPPFEPCRACGGTGRQPARPPINWQPIIQAIGGVVLLVVSSITAYFANNADTKAEAATKQITAVQKDIDAVHGELKAQRPVFYGKKD